MIAAENLDLIKTHLPKDWVARVKETLPYSESAIRSVLRGQLNNEEILSSIIKIATDNKAIKEKQAARFAAEIKLLKS